MDIKRFNISPMVSNILLIIVIACSAAVMYTINQIDQIINVRLYDYGLTWDAGWSVPYHNFKWIAYGSLTATIIVCVAVMALGFLKMKQETNAAPKETQSIYQTIPASTYTPQKTEEPKPSIFNTKSKAATKEDKKPKQNKQNNTDTATTTSSTQNGVCPGCKKSFTQSLVMLDFEGGKSKLVNVCPHCNYVLGDADKNQ